MGQSTTAYLRFGVAYDFCDDFENEDLDDVEARIDRIMEKLEVVCPQPVEEPYSSPLWEEWRVKQQEYQKNEVGWSSAGYYNENTFILYIIGSQQSAYACEVTEVNTEQFLWSTMEWQRKLKEFMEAAKLPIKEPKWLLSTLYG